MTIGYVGIDVSKKTLDVAIIKDPCKKPFYKVVENTATGFQVLLSYLQSLAVDLHICLESTGIYGQPVACFMHQAGIKVSIVNPNLIKSFASSEGMRAKTDKVDAAVIARFCRVREPQAWNPPSESHQKLQALNRCLDILIEDKTRLLGRIEGTIRPEAAQVWKDLLLEIEEKIKSINQKIKDLFNNDEALRNNLDLLESIPGIGERTATTYLAELPDIGQFKNAKEIVAFIGLAPKIKQSGSSVRGRGRICKMGNRNLRKALYMPALSAKRHNPTIKAFCDNLSQKGKNKKVIVVAAMRKLLHIIFGVLKNGKEFTAAT